MSEKIPDKLLKNIEKTQDNEKTFYYKFHLDKVFSFPVKTNNGIEKQPFLILAAFFIFALIISSVERLFFIEDKQHSIEFQILIIILSSIILLSIGFLLEKFINKEKFANLINFKLAILRTMLFYFPVLIVCLAVLHLLFVAFISFWFLVVILIILFDALLPFIIMFFVSFFFTDKKESEKG